MYHSGVCGIWNLFCLADITSLGGMNWYLKIHTTIDNIGNLTFINSLGKKEIISNDTTITEILNSFSSSVFVKEENTNFTPLEHLSNVISMKKQVINELDILKRIDKIDINKSPGPDGIHPRIL